MVSLSIGYDLVKIFCTICVRVLTLSDFLLIALLYLTYKQCHNSNNKKRSHTHSKHTCIYMYMYMYMYMYIVHMHVYIHISITELE